MAGSDGRLPRRTALACVRKASAMAVGGCVMTSSRLLAPPNMAFAHSGLGPLVDASLRASHKASAYSVQEISALFIASLSSASSAAISSSLVGINGVARDWQREAVGGLCPPLRSMRSHSSVDFALVWAGL